MVDDDVLQRQAQDVRGDLGQRGLHALAVALEPGVHGHRPLRVHLDHGRLVAGDDGHAAPDELGGPVGGLLAEHRDADPDALSGRALAQQLPHLLQRLGVGA